MSIRVRLVIDVEVTDVDRLQAYAQKRFMDCWGSTSESAGYPQQIAGEVLEALVLSNENPSPDECGIEIVDSSASEL